MIIDKIENSHLYYGISSDIRECLEYLKEKKYPVTATPRFPVGTNSSFNVTEYTTKPFKAREWEAHDHCIDLQYVISGNETISYANRESLQYTGSTEGKDHLCFQGDGAVLPLNEGYFCILFPDDVHKTKTIQNEPSKVLKGVFKIKI